MKDMLAFQQEFIKRQKQCEMNSIEQEEELFLKNINTLNKNERKSVYFVYQFSKNLEYKHPGTYANYINHLLRMCNICFKLCNGYRKDILITILVHNVFEVTDLTFDSLSEAVGLPIAKYVKILTLNRDKEWDSIYKKEYYNNIAQNTICACTKIIDKIDNLFMIETNPDKNIRDKYIDEIVTHVIPMAVEQQNIQIGSKLLSNIISHIID